jgi:hypothetical protein
MAEKSGSMPNGAAAAAILASGVGCSVIGAMTTGAELSAGLKTALTWSAPVGPLSGKTLVGVIAWLITWVILHFMWKDKDVNFRRMYVAALVLIAMGLLLTFPIFFQAFAPE